MTRKPEELRTCRALKALDQAAQDYSEAVPHRTGCRPRLRRSQRPWASAARSAGRRPPKTSIGVRLPRSVLAELDRVRGDRTRQEVVREAVRRWLRPVRRRRPG